MKPVLSFFALMPCLLAGQTHPAWAGRLPDAALNLKLKAPITTWDEAVPLGNGLLGGLLWGEGSRLRLSLDRGDLWDERVAPEFREKAFTFANLVHLVHTRNQTEINRLINFPYNRPVPSKIPAGRLEIELAPTQRLTDFELDLATAQGIAHLSDGPRLTVFFSADSPVALLYVPGPAPRSLRLIAPASVAKLGYPPARPGQEGTFQWFVQEAVEGPSFCVYLGSARTGGGTLVSLAITSSRDGGDPLRLARQRVALALAKGYEVLLKPHLQWWAGFWERSCVRFPDPPILRHYYLVQYFYGAASRRGAPPMPLQGVWTADAGDLPPWKGDYHNDLNTQTTYLGYQGSGRFDEGRSFLDFNTRLLPTYRKFARDFFGTPGANLPGVMTLHGEPLGGWAQYTVTPTMGPWVCHLFYLHWRYTADRQFLRESAYPLCREFGDSVAALLKPDEKGILKLPLSASPEIHNESLQAWLRPNSNFDLLVLKMHFLALQEMADELGDQPAGRRWAKLAERLGPVHTAADGTLLLTEGEPLRESHRHLSNLIGIYPFNLQTVEGSPRERQIIAASLRQWDRLGTQAWCGYSFSWMAALRARTGDAEAARRYLDIFVKAFILRNGFHANGDQTRSGYSSFTYRPFTLEGNMLAAAAVHEMLMQSWSARPGTSDWGTIRLFPAVPRNWAEVSFEDLRAEGGHRVSARREGGATVWFRVVVGRDGAVRIRDNFGGRQPHWNRDGVAKVGQDFLLDLKAGQTLEAKVE